MVIHVIGQDGGTGKQVPKGGPAEFIPIRTEVRARVALAQEQI